jgi:hypothetical protein
MQNSLINQPQLTLWKGSSDQPLTTARNYSTFLLTIPIIGTKVGTFLPTKISRFDDESSWRVPFAGGFTQQIWKQKTTSERVSIDRLIIVLG